MEGIIDTIAFADLVNMFVLLKESPALRPGGVPPPAAVVRSVHPLAARGSDGAEGFRQEADHGLSYHAQIIAYARFCGNEELAAEHLKIVRNLIVAAVDERGFLPEEIHRTRSWHYSAFALQMIFRSVGAGKAQGIDLFAPGSESFRAIERAVERMLKSYLDPAEKWPYPLLNGELEPGAFANVVLQYHAGPNRNPPTGRWPDCRKKTSRCSTASSTPPQRQQKSDRQRGSSFLHGPSSPDRTNSSAVRGTHRSAGS